MPDVPVSQSCQYTVLLGASALHFASTAQQASYGRQARIGKANLKRKQSKGKCVWRCADDMMRTEFQKLVGSIFGRKQITDV